jgi:hypothetical protein
MAEEFNPIKTLNVARDKLVEERRALASVIALGYRRRRTDETHTNEMRDTFIAVQNTIEAIERATEHEKMLHERMFADENPATFIVPTLVPSDDASEVVNQIVEALSEKGK